MCFTSAKQILVNELKVCLFLSHKSRTMHNTIGLSTRSQGQGHKKKSEAKDSLSEDRTSRGQGQECSRPRPRIEDTGASVLLKKNRVFKNIFQTISNSLSYPKFLIKEGLNHKSHDMTSSKFFQRGSFCGTKIS